MSDGFDLLRVWESCQFANSLSRSERISCSTLAVYRGVSWDKSWWIMMCPVLSGSNCPSRAQRRWRGSGGMFWGIRVECVLICNGGTSARWCYGQSGWNLDASKHMRGINLFLYLQTNTETSTGGVHESFREGCDLPIPKWTSFLAKTMLC